MSRGTAGCIVFAHANGFPAGTYRVLFNAWKRRGWRVLAPEKLAHDPQYPVSDSWPHLRDQLIHFIEAEAPGESVHLVGHSLGGYLGLLVACHRPDLAKSVVLIDSPVLGGWRAHSVHMAKLTGLMPRVSPARNSRTRRDHWPSVAAAHRHFAAKSIFVRWDPRVLRDYIKCGIVRCTPPDKGVCLAFDRAIETRLYNTLPHDMGRLLRAHPPACPVSYLGGTQSNEGRQAGLAATRAVTQGRIQWFEGSHLFPMERPEDTAAAVLQAIGAAHGAPQ